MGVREELRAVPKLREYLPVVGSGDRGESVTFPVRSHSYGTPVRMAHSLTVCLPGTILPLIQVLTVLRLTPR
jgi:hypothetical protein